MTKFRLSRRAVLRGAGSIAIALPWLEVMTPERHANAQPAATAQRFISVYTPGGAVIQPVNRWSPTGTEDEFNLSPILAPLEPVKNRLLVADGLQMASAVGEQHQAGIIALLTGTTQRMPPANGGIPGQTSYAQGPSIDQVIATRLQAATPRRRRSIEMAVRWATGKSHGLISPINAVNFEDDAAFSPIPPRLDPQQIFDDVFGTLLPGDSAAAAARIERKRSILDFVDRRYAALSLRLGAADRQKIEQHLTKIRELEQGLSGLTPPASACLGIDPVDTSDYNPRTGLNSSDNGSVTDTPTDAAIPKVGTFMMDMMVMALACDITSVGTIQWSDTEAKHTFPWLGLGEHHHFYQHDGGFRPAECEAINTWYSSMHSHLLQQMASVDMGGHSLLDESVVFFGSELADPPTHRKVGMPFLLAGGGGGLRSGRWVRYDGQSHNDLLLAILNLFGDSRETFGDPEYCTGPLSGIA